MAEKLFLHCSVHGTSTRRATCSLSSYVRAAWRGRNAKTEEALIMTVVDRADPAHGAVCSEDREGVFRDARRDSALHALKSAIRSGKLAKTKAANKQRRAALGADKPARARGA